MIGFYRRIRKKLADDNQFLKYSRYAIGEILLVMVGILLALQVNTWNEGRKLIRAEADFIRGIKTDIEQDRIYILEILNFGNNKSKAFEVLNNDTSDAIFINKQTLDSILQIVFQSSRTFYPISGYYQSAVSGGQLGEFKNKIPVNKIIKLYNSTYNRLVDNGKILDDRWNFVTRKHSGIRRIGFKEISSAQYNELLDDLYYYYRQLEHYNEKLMEALEEINMLDE